MPRGVRLNNPLNMEFGQHYQGEIEPSSDSRFAQFKDAPHGFRATAKDFKTKARKGVNTVRKLVSVWAPPKNNRGQFENDTEAYIHRVCRQLEITDRTPVDLTKYEDARSIMKAMSVVEQGGWFFKDADLDKGLAMAGILPEQKPLTQSRTIQGGTVAATATVGTAAASPEVLDTVKEYLPVVREAVELAGPYMQYAKWGLLAAAVVGIGYVIYARWDDKRRGLR